MRFVSVVLNGWSIGHTSFRILPPPQTAHHHHSPRHFLEMRAQQRFSRAHYAFSTIVHPITSLYFPHRWPSHQPLVQRNTATASHDLACGWLCLARKELERAICQVACCVWEESPASKHLKPGHIVCYNVLLGRGGCFLLRSTFINPLYDAYTIYIYI